MAAPAALAVTVMLASAGQLLARPEYFARYRANPFARPELKTCGVCHENPQGGGPRNDFGSAFANAGRRFTPELRAKFPDRFLQDRANLGDGVEIVFQQGPDGTLLVRQGRNTYRVNAATKDVEKVEDATAGAAAGGTRGRAAPAAESSAGSPVFDYQLVDVRTGKIAQKGEFNFRFSHRFSSPIFNQSNRPFDMFGLDTFAYTGLGVSYGITKRLAVNAYRQVWDRKLEFSGDLAVVDQNESRSPVTVLTRAAIDGRNDFASGGHGGHYTPSLQLVVQRTFAKRFSINIDPTFVFQTGGLDPGALRNSVIALGVGASLKLRENMAIVGEAIPRLTKNPLANDIFHAEPTASFGFQFRTNRHVFEIVVSNAWETNIAGSALGGPDEKHIGFNLYRRIK
ncbi:MAG: hypothetical protein DMG07_01025 [Acidobacteria bacterium]|nr:MAG: hypothetical protein DMG07_01025 [Acidobacteriota bacterium]